MAKLIIHIEGAPDRIVEIRSGSHQIGRDQGSDIVILHPSVSSQHCMVELCEEGLLVRDLGSTNGTELDGQPVLEATAQSGQVIRIGSVACAVEGVVPKVVIPKWEHPPPPELPPGVKPCCNHPEFGASMKCSHCHALFCGACVHLMRRQGGTLHKLSPAQRNASRRDSQQQCRTGHRRPRRLRHCQDAARMALADFTSRSISAGVPRVIRR